MKTEYTPEDIERGLQWYRQHQDHVDRLTRMNKNTRIGKYEYPMSGSDISNPALWKPAAWRWFLARYR